MTWLRRGPHLRPGLIRHISLTMMRAEGRKVLIDPCLQQCETTSNGLSTSPRRHSQLPIQVRQRHCTLSDLILIGIDSLYRVRSHPSSGLIRQQCRANNSHVIGCTLRLQSQQIQKDQTLNEPPLISDNNFFMLCLKTSISFLIIEFNYDFINEELMTRFDI